MSIEDRRFNSEAFTSEVMQWLDYMRYDLSNEVFHAVEDTARQFVNVRKVFTGLPPRPFDSTHARALEGLRDSAGRLSTALDDLLKRGGIY